MADDFIEMLWKMTLIMGVIMAPFIAYNLWINPSLSWVPVGDPITLEVNETWNNLTYNGRHNTKGELIFKTSPPMWVTSGDHVTIQSVTYEVLEINNDNCVLVPVEAG